ncbi:hypothetical protein B0G84_8073 [Paraburkholderia sp. BL8N3]|nr:hypothetical protein B0G84_8073 [Paraburkholderia sp. BL8N3]
MSLQVPRPIDPSLHPLVTGNYRIATPAIEAFYELIVRCLRYRVMGALTDRCTNTALCVRGG